MTDFSIQNVLEQLCAERGWEIRSTACHYTLEGGSAFARAQFSTEGSDIIKIGAYRINVDRSDLEYKSVINQSFRLVDPESLVKIFSFFEEIENETASLYRLFSFLKKQQSPWGVAERLIRQSLEVDADQGLTQLTYDGLMGAER